jgi:NAD(P)-dependent dehydrogenase (short-subunit alcohol dehydrogenase family)
LLRKTYGRDLTHAINVKGVWWGCKYAIQSMMKHGKGGSIINTASMVAKVGSAAPQIACTLFLTYICDARYGFEGRGSGVVERIGDCACKGWNSCQRTLSRPFEYGSASKLSGYSGKET